MAAREINVKNKHKQHNCIRTTMMMTGLKFLQPNQINQDEEKIHRMTMNIQKKETVEMPTTYNFKSKFISKNLITLALHKDSWLDKLLTRINKFKSI